MKGLRFGLVPLLVLAAAGVLAASATAATPALDSTERATLLSLREEEKLAHDVYVALARTSADDVFLKIAAAETRHARALERMLARYGIADPTDGLAEGVFATAAFQRAYNDLVARGSASAAAAYAVGQTIEREDIAALTAAIAGTDEPALDRVYSNLRAASQRHLAAFDSQPAATAACPGAPYGPRWSR
jgi:hypothetical protein